MSDWVLRHPVPAAPRARLICLPYAGGGASYFRNWCDPMAPDIEVVPIQLPGRETRFREPPHASFHPVLEALGPLIESMHDLPIAIFGHSMGGHLGFELARTLRRRGGPMPFHLFISSRQSVRLPPHAALLGELTDDEFITEVRARYAAGVAVDDLELYKAMLPIIRADVLATETYPFADEEPFDFPITALGGKGDDWVSKQGLEAWATETRGAFRCELFEGAHFYLNESRRAVLELLRTLLAATIPRP